ncbi:MAG: molybdopterin-guanine dinucleotide biosynthesis protein B [Syntrophomonadaceae bacterium]|nr:molybdopterin-guanine dinucleotide biosynthesis protein B [Syntrophomonadaceae bacterium]
MVPVIAFVGKHNSGKTTLLTKVIKELNNRGIEVGVIKHAHQNVEIPDANDSEKLFNAGAAVVYTDSPDIQIIYARAKSEPVDEIIKKIAPTVDLIILEGYKTEPYPKIEVLRQEISQEPLPIDNVIARVLDFELKTESQVPEFNFDEVTRISQFITDYIIGYKNNLGRL